jgi:hypothetical protein
MTNKEAKTKTKAKSRPYGMTNKEAEQMQIPPLRYGMTMAEGNDNGGGGMTMAEGE